MKPNIIDKFNTKLDDNSKLILVACIVALTSQFYINISPITYFPISMGIVLFKEIDSVKLGFLSGILVCLFRVSMHPFLIPNEGLVVLTYIPEIFFYIVYGILFKFLRININTSGTILLFLRICICDIMANVIEASIRYFMGILVLDKYLFGMILLAAMIRSFVVVLTMSTITNYRIYILEKDHKTRYQNLIWMISQLKSELFWMEKSMDNIENVMTKAYTLHEDIDENINSEQWSKKAIDIARDIHEVKKEYFLIVNGMGEIINDEKVESRMKFSEIVNILANTMNNESTLARRDIKFRFDYDVVQDFFTDKQYQLMSVFRNLLTNSMEACGHRENTVIRLEYIYKNGMHIFMESDNGPGISDEDKELIFSPGFSTKINYDTGQINRGLGLSIVKNIVEEKLKGEIHLDNSFNKGTKFIMNIPKGYLGEG